MQLVIVGLIVVALFAGCDKFPWTHKIKKLETTKEQKAKATSKSKPKEIKTVQHIQLALTNAGYYKGPIDGKLSVALTKAVKQYQKDNGLAPDGEAGVKTKAKLKKFIK